MALESVQDSNLTPAPYECGTLNKLIGPSEPPFPYI